MEKGLILYRTHFRKMLLWSQPLYLTEEAKRWTQRCAVGILWHPGYWAVHQTPYLKWAYERFLCRRPGRGQASEKTLHYSSSEKDEGELFKNKGCLLAVRTSEANKTPVWRVDSGEQREGNADRRGQKRQKGHSSSVDRSVCRL